MCQALDKLTAGDTAVSKTEKVSTVMELTF